MEDSATVLVIDNYDSFVYNLVQYVGEVVTTGEWLPDVNGEVVVRRNDAIGLSGIDDIEPDAIVVSPGPGTPEEAGISMPLFGERAYPTLGVCLGHQALCATHCVPVGHAEAVVHGKESIVSHDGEGIFEGVPAAFEVGRYHSLAAQRDRLPDCLVETATTEDEQTVVMGVRHRERPHVGVQFHPESILTSVGKQLVANFLGSALGTAPVSPGESQ
jgi:anthranilate synthase component 2